MKYILVTFILLTVFILPVHGQHSFQSSPQAMAKGDRLYEQEKYKDALSAYASLPESEEVLKRRGAAKIKLWNMDAAITDLRRALKQDPDDRETMAFLAEALSWEKQFDEAIALYRRALAGGSPAEHMRVGYARTLAWDKDIDGALEQYRIAAREFPESLDAHMGLGKMYSWKREFDKSIAAYRRVVSLTDIGAYKSVALAQVGKIQTWKGDMDAAENAYREALRQDRENVDAMFGLGELNEWEGEYRKAKSYYQDILQVQPDHKKAKAKLLQLMWVK